MSWQSILGWGPLPETPSQNTQNTQKTSQSRRNTNCAYSAHSARRTSVPESVRERPSPRQTTIHILTRLIQHMCTDYGVYVPAAEIRAELDADTLDEWPRTPVETRQAWALAISQRLARRRELEFHQPGEK